MKKLFRPKIVIPIIFGVAVLAALFSFADVQRIIALMAGFQRIYLLYILLLMVAYEFVRFIQWNYLLNSAGIKVPIKAQVFAFVGGEITRTLPLGNFFQNYMLQRAEGTDFGYSSSVSMLIILTEVAVSLIGLIIFGISGWRWLRVIVILGLLLFALAVWTVYHFHATSRLPRKVTEHNLWKRLLDEIGQFKKGFAKLERPSVLITESALSAVYLVIAGSALYLVLLGLSITNVAYWDVLSVYFFSLAVALMFPLPVDFGVIEISGVGAFLAIGLSREAAVSAVLINRVLSIGSAFVIALITMIVIFDELKVALGERNQCTLTKPESIQKK